MAVNFGKPACISNTNEKIFGICDDPPPSASPAYIDLTDDAKWIAWVDNDNERDVAFTAIDHCVEIKRPDGSIESSCDGMLQYDSTIVFAELKDRKSSGWLGKARDQLQITINTYKANVGLQGFNRYYGYVANRQRPSFNASNLALAAKFEHDTGFILVVDPIIKIH